MSRPEDLATSLVDGERRALARAITLIESSRPEDRDSATALLQAVAGSVTPSFRVGVSGVPGVGKSTFLERLGMHCLDQGHKVAVLAVDPSSTLTGGSILGDKTRMAELSTQTDAFVRPSPTGGTLGGVTRRTRESMTLCEAAGFDMVFVETVGVGQSETAVADMTDMFMLLLLPGGGDELQGIKRGIVELADLILVNKADGELTAAAGRSAADYRNALRLLTPRWQHWQTPVQTCSALEGAGIAEAYDSMQRFLQAHRHAGAFEGQRRRQAVSWLWSETTETLLGLLRRDEALSHLAQSLENRVSAGEVLPTVAARELVDAFLQHSKE